MSVLALIIALLPHLETSTGIAPEKLVKTRESDGFVINRGQFDPQVRFIGKVGGATIFLTDHEFRFQVPDIAASSSQHRSIGTNVFLKFVDCSELVQIEGLDPLPGVHNYFVGNDPQRFKTHVPIYKTVRYTNLYPGIDVEVFLNSGKLKYNVIARPGADISQFLVQVQGSDCLAVNEFGSLVIGTTHGDIAQSIPHSFQVGLGGKREAVSGHFRLLGPSLFGFELSNAVSEAETVIDPDVLFGYYLGGTGASASDNTYDIAVDNAGSAHITGIAESSDFPTTPGSYDTSIVAIDGYVTKINPSGTEIVFSTFFGTVGKDAGYGIAVDSSGNSFVTGEVGNASLFPAFPGGNYTGLPANSGIDAVVLKFNSTGSQLLYGTLIGGKRADVGLGIAVDGSGDIYVCGRTAKGSAGEPDFPTTSGVVQPNHNNTVSGANDAFIIKITPNSSQSWTNNYKFGTFLGTVGGNSASDVAYAITLDGSNNVFVTGSAGGGGFPTNSGFDTTFSGSKEGFVTKLNSTATAISYSTFIGGSSDETCFGVKVDSSGVIYACGETKGLGYSGTSGYDNTYSSSLAGFLIKFDPLQPRASQLKYWTYIEGSSGSNTTARDLCLDQNNHPTVFGQTGATSGFPILSSSAVQTSHQGGSDFFVVKFNPAGGGASDLKYGSYLGGDGNEAFLVDPGNGIAVIPNQPGAVYVAGSTTSLNNLPANNSLGGSIDGYIAKVAVSVITVQLGTGIPNVATGTNSGEYLVDAGGLVIIVPGTYTEHTTLDKPATYISSGSGGNVTIN